MRREIAVTILAIQLAMASGSAQAAYHKEQLQELNTLLDRGDIEELVHFWNRNIKSFSRSSKVENLLADLMGDIRENGVGEISESLLREGLRGRAFDRPSTPAARRNAESIY